MDLSDVDSNSGVCGVQVALNCVCGMGWRRFWRRWRSGPWAAAVDRGPSESVVLMPFYQYSNVQYLV